MPRPLSATELERRWKMNITARRLLLNTSSSLAVWRLVKCTLARVSGTDAMFVHPDGNDNFPPSVLMSASAAAPSLYRAWVDCFSIPKEHHTGSSSTSTVVSSGSSGGCCRQQWQILGLLSTELWRFPPASLGNWSGAATPPCFCGTKMASPACKRYDGR